MARGKLNRGEQAARQVRVGAVLILAIAILGYGIFQVGRLFDVFASRYTLVTLVEGSAGLIEGSPVTLAGQRVGQVGAIDFLPVEQRTDSANIRVLLSINRSVRDQIRSDSRAAVQTQGLLGDRFVNISPGSSAAPVLDPGDTIQSHPALDYDSVLRTAATALEQVQDVVIDLRAITGSMAAGQGTLGALLQDQRLYERMTTATNELAGLLRTVNRSDGTLSQLIRDPTLYNRLSTTLARLDSLGEVALDGEGTLGRLIRDDSLYSALVAVTGRADTTLAGVEGMVQDLADGDGAVARLLEDPELYDQLLKTVVDLQNLIQALREDPSALGPTIRVF